jgi:hypothetical protein
LTQDSLAWEAYEEAFRLDVHQLLAWGYTDARSLITSNSEEEEITGLIVEAIETRLDDPLTDERYSRYEVAEDKPLPGETRTGKRRRRADIRIRSTVRKPRPRYLFEGKRLRRNGFGVSKYLGDSGLKRFILESSYSAYTNFGSMVAYVQSDTPAEWAVDLAAAFERSPSQWNAEGGFVRDTVIDCIEYCFVTAHVRATAEKVSIHHVLLDCT